MNQKIAWSTFSTGGVAFMATATEMLGTHNEWSYFYSTPLGFLHAVVLGMSFVAMIGGAVGVQLPRSDSAHGDRREDQVVTKPAPTVSDSKDFNG